MLIRRCLLLVLAACAAVALGAALQETLHGVAEVPTHTTTVLRNSFAAKGAKEECAEADDKVSPHSGKFWVYVGICGGLVSLGGIMSGLTVGLFSIDPNKLSLLELDHHISQEKKDQAAKLKPLIEQHHLLLVTLLVANAAAMESLPIFLDQLVPSYAAIIISVTCVLMFGEIIPQALCTRDPLGIGARFAPFVRLVMFILYPISWPIAKLLDYLLGHESSTILFKRSELDALFRFQSSATGGNLLSDEVLVMSGALKLKEKKVRQCMTPIEEATMLPDTAVLDEATMAMIMGSGHSRIPIYAGDDTNNITGLILVKRLIVCDPKNKRPVKPLASRYPIVVPPDVPMFAMLNIFQKRRSHIALVCTEDEMLRQTMRGNIPYKRGAFKVLGIITLEDVIEELIQEEIFDEHDFDEFDHAVRKEVGVQKAIIKFKSLLLRHKRASPIATHVSTHRKPVGGSLYTLLEGDEEEKEHPATKENVDLFIYK